MSSDPGSESDADLRAFRAWLADDDTDSAEDTTESIKSDRDKSSLTEDMSTQTGSTPAENPSIEPPPTYQGLCDALTARVSGHQDVIRQLALSFDVRWCGGRSGIAERILLVGTSGSGKSHLLTALGESLNMPWVSVDATQISESGWQGMQPADIMTQLYDAVAGSLDRLAAGNVLLVIDEIDKLCPRYRRDPQSVSVRHGRQQSLLALLGGATPIRFPAFVNGQLGSLTARTDRIPIVCAGAFPGLLLRGGEPPSDSALTRYGMIPEFTSRLTTRLTLTARTPAELVAMWRAPGGILADADRAAAALGIALTVTDGALAVVAHAVAAAVDGLTPRGGAGVIMRAVRTALIREIEHLEAARGGDHGDNSPSVTVTPDDVIIRPLPRTPRGTQW